MAILKKRKNTFDSYELEVSYAELMAIQAMGEKAGDPVGDELSRAITWYLSEIVPPPGADENPNKASKKGDAEADALLGSPEGDEAIEVIQPEIAAGPAPEVGSETPPPAPPIEPEAEVNSEMTVDDEADRLLPTG